MSHVVLLGDSTFDNSAYVAGGPDVVAQLRAVLPALGWLADAAEEFEERYRQLVTTLISRRLPLAVCTIYNGNPEPPVRRIAATALSVFNDAILRVAAEHSVRVIELRLVCTEPRDYANPIEPSVIGGAKIARAIAAAVAGTKLKA